MRLGIVFALFALAVAQPLRADDAEAARGVRRIIAHRGSSIDRPENTLSSLRRAIEVKADVSEIDVRTSRDGVLVCLHDADLSRTTDGKGKVSEKSLAELKKLDAGKWLDAKYAGERIPTLREALSAAKGKIDLMLDLKEEGDTYLRAIASEVKKHGEPKRTVVGVRSLAHVRQIKKLLPEATLIGLVPDVDSIEAFAKEGVKTIRLWPKWLSDRTLVPRVRKLKVGLLFGAGKGTKEEVLPLLTHRPEMLSADDPAQLRKVLVEVGK